MKIKRLPPFSTLLQPNYIHSVLWTPMEHKVDVYIPNLNINLLQYSKTSWIVLKINSLDRYILNISLEEFKTNKSKRKDTKNQYIDYKNICNYIILLLTNVGLEPSVVVYWRIYWRWNQRTYGLVPVMMIWWLTRSQMHGHSNSVLENQRHYLLFYVNLVS